MSKIGLTEIVEMLRTLSPDELKSKEEIFEYTTNLDEIATDVLKEVPNDNLMAAVALVQTVVMAQLTEDGDLDLSNLTFMLSGNFAKILTIAFKTSVGISIVEEYR